MKVPLKVLSLCSAGVCRSGALTIAAKRLGHDALQAGVDRNEPETIAMLAAWADVILLAEPGMIAQVPGEHAAKCVDTGLGPDRWENPLHPELTALAAGILVGVSL